MLRSLKKSLEYSFLLPRWLMKRKILHNKIGNNEEEKQKSNIITREGDIYEITFATHELIDATICNNYFKKKRVI